MKKLFLILVMTATAASVFAQTQLSTIRGKTKDGKTIKVEYYQGAVEDVIKSVQYQLVDELQADVKSLESQKKTLENQKKSLQDQYDNANKEVTRLNKRVRELESAGNPDAEVKKIRADLAAKEKEVNDLNVRLTGLNRQINEKDTMIKALNDEIAQKQHVIDSLSAIKPVVDPQPVNNKEIEQLRKQVNDKEATIKDLNRQLANCGSGLPDKPARTPVIGVEVGFGPVFPGKTVSEPWAKQVKSGLQAALYFGTARLSESFPISVEAGVGFRSLGMAASLNEYGVTQNSTDADGDTYQAIYAYNGLQENLSLAYLDIPIRLCFGQPAKDRVTAYAKLGLTPSVKVSSKFEATGQYSLKGYYPQWDVTLEDVEALGFGSDLDCYAATEADVKSFNLWGTVAFGAYVPFKGSPIVLNAGVKLDYPFMSIGSISGTAQLPNGQSGLLQAGAVVVPTVEIGLVYTLK